MGDKLLPSRSAAIHIGLLTSVASDDAPQAYEVRATGAGCNGFFDAVRALKSAALHGPGFVYLAAPCVLSRPEIRTVAEYAEAAGMRHRLCIGYRYRHGDSDLRSACADLESAGLRAALDDVDADCSFADLTAHPVCAVRFSEALTSAVIGDPRSAAIVESMAGLARNIGVATIATGVERDAGPVIAELGLQYIGESDDLVIRGPRSGAAAATSSRSQYQGAVYAP